MRCERVEPLTNQQCNSVARFDVVYKIVTVKLPFGKRLCMPHLMELQQADPRWFQLMDVKECQPSSR